MNTERTRRQAVRLVETSNRTAVRRSWARYTPEARVGDTVRYHGSQSDAHGLYVVELLPLGDNPNGRGYWLTQINEGARELYNVHRDSFTIEPPF